MTNYNFLSIAAGLCIFILGATLLSCEKDSVQKLPKKDWTLVWSDEFDETLVSKPDASKWSYDIGTGMNGWGNNELQYYTNRLDVVSTDGKGNLNIIAKKESFGGMSYVSGRILTKNKFSQQYGRVEARIKTPYGPGIWPAFWMLGQNIDTVSWPNCGEIDILELKGQQPSTVYGSVHGPGYSAGNSISGSHSLRDSRFDQDFHVFAVEWSANSIDFFVDDYLYNRIEKSEVEEKGNWVFDQPFFIVLNLAVGGDFVGFPNVNTSFPQTIQVDYVRVYK